MWREVTDLVYPILMLKMVQHVCFVIQSDSGVLVFVERLNQSNEVFWKTQCLKVERCGAVLITDTLIVAILIYIRG